MKKTAIEFTSCHRKPERSFFWKGKQFPVCARCTGIHLGYFTLPLFLFNLISFNIWITIVLMLPTIIDGWVQAKYDIESNNIRRVVTGFMAGLGTMSLMSIIGKAIGNLILSLIL